MNRSSRRNAFDAIDIVLAVETQDVWLHGSLQNRAFAINIYCRLQRAMSQGIVELVDSGDFGYEIAFVKPLIRCIVSASLLDKQQEPAGGLRGLGETRDFANKECIFGHVW